MGKRYIYILLTDTGTLFTKTIKQYTKAPYNHSSISFDKDLNEMYSFGRKHPRNPINGGFVQEEVVDGTYKVFPKTTCALYELETSERTIQKMRRIINLFKKNSSQMSYNLLGVLGVALKEKVEPQGSYFCSQFVAEVLMRSGIRLWDKDAALITPNDFRNVAELKLVYEGKLFEYEPVKNRMLDLENI